MHCCWYALKQMIRKAQMFSGELLKNGFNTFWHQTLKYSHMGQIPQDGENGQNVAFSYFFEAQLWPNGSRWARTKTKTFLEFNGENLFRTVEKSWKKSNRLVTVELQKINKNATLWPFSPSWGIWRIYEWGNRPEWSPGRNSPLLKLFSFFLRTSQCFPFWRRKSKPDFNPGALAVRAECMCQYPSLNLNLFDLNICDQPKNIARITKAVLHKLFGKSSLNIRSVCPASPLHLPVLSVSPVPSVPVVLSVVMTMT